jgi:hypothetical protein
MTTMIIVQIISKDAFKLHSLMNMGVFTAKQGVDFVKKFASVKEVGLQERLLQ